MELYGRRLNVRRLVLYIIALAAILAAGAIVLPAGLVRLIIMGVAALPVLVYLFDKPQLVFYIFTFIVFSNIDTYVGFPIFRGVTLFLLASFLIALVLGRKVVVHNSYFAALVTAFIILIVQSLVVSRHLDISLGKMGEFAKILLNLAFTVQFVTNRREFRIFLVVVALAVAVGNVSPSFMPPPEHYAGPSLLSTQGVFRFEGLFFEPNMVAFLQIFFIPFYIFLVMVYRKPFIGPVLLVTALLLSVAAMVMSFSRGSFVSFAFLFLLFLYLERRNRAIVTLGFIVIVLGILLVPPSYYARIGSLLDAVSASSQDLPIFSRLETSRVALEMGIEHPVAGIGLDNFMQRSAFYTALPYTVHNALLQIFSEVGIFAVGVFIAIICYNIRIIRDLMKREGDGEASQLGRILLLQQLAVLLNAMFIPTAYVDVMWYTLLFPTLAHYAYRSAASSEE